MNPGKILPGVVVAALLVLAVRSAPVEKTVTVEGYVLDSACAFTKNLKKPISAECARQCAGAGSPLVILSDDGYIYWPVSDAMPATGQNPRLLPFAGQKVIARGRLFERSGSRALVIDKIEAAPARH